MAEKSNSRAAKAGVHIGRRAFMASAGSASLTGCVTCRMPAPVPVGNPLADAHAHFFNASDLPVAGFLKYSMIPEYLPKFPQIALALVDLAAWLAKILSVSAKDEISRLGAGQLFGKTVDATRFANEAASHHREQMAGRRFSALAKADPLTDLGASYMYLALLIGAIPAQQLPDMTRADSTADVTIDPAVYHAIAERGAAAPTPRQRVDDAELSTWLAMDPAEVKAIIHWVFVMCQSRCSHVRRYLTTINIPEGRVRDAANLLVDYDAWLGDGPRAGSSHERQVEFWTRYADAAARIAGAPRIRTFGGVDPLRLVEDRLRSPAAPTHFDTMKQWVRDGRTPGSRAPHRIVGFKLYPPMGFRPDSSTGIPLPTDRAGAVVRQCWSHNGWDVSHFGTRIDDALETIFHYAAENDIPIIAHARESNGASSQGNSCAAPQHWIGRAEKVAGYGSGFHPLRVMLAHTDLYGADQWVLAKALAMNKAGKARIYFDLSYDYDILNDQAAWLLNMLGSICKAADDDGDYICFGSDWIMLGQQAQAPAYLRNLYDLASKDCFWKPRLNKLLRDNFLAFLNLPAAV